MFTGYDYLVMLLFDSFATNYKPDYPVILILTERIFETVSVIINAEPSIIECRLKFSKQISTREDP